MVSDIHQDIPEKEFVRPNERLFHTKMPSSSSSSSDSSSGSTISSWRVRAAVILFTVTLVFAMRLSSPGEYDYSSLNGGKNGQLGSSNNARKMGSGVVVSVCSLGKEEKEKWLRPSTMIILLTSVASISAVLPPVFAQ